MTSLKMNITSVSARALVLVMFALVCALALSAVADTDAWGHLVIGRAILSDSVYHEGEDPFVFASNSSLRDSYPYWFFAVLTYAVYIVTGGAGLTFLKALLALSAFYLLYRHIREGGAETAIAAATLAISALMAAPRFVLRPEILAMSFICFSLYASFSFMRSGSRLVYTLIPLSTLWANTHTSVILLPVMLITLIAGSLFQKRFYSIGRTELPPAEPARITTLSIVLVFVVLAATASPAFINLIHHGAHGMPGASLWQRQELSGLQPPAGALLWFLLIFNGIAMASAALNHRRMDLAELFSALSLMVVSFVAGRFVFLSAIAAAPVIARNLSDLLRPRRHVIMPLAISAVSICALMAAMNQPFFLKRTSPPGLGFNYSNVPKGAMDFLESRGVSGNIFNSFEFGYYILWRTYPTGKVFVDGRAALEEPLLDAGALLWNEPGMIDKLWRRFGFEGMVLDIAGAQSGRSFNPGPDWSLVYWDDRAAVYLRSDNPVALKEVYRNASPFEMSESALDNALTDELERSYKQTGAQITGLMLAKAYLNANRFDDALTLSTGIKDTDALELRAAASLYRASAMKSLGRLNEALAAFEESIEIEDTAEARLGAAGTAMSLGDLTMAQNHAEAALVKDPSAKAAYIMLAGIYERLGRREQISNLIKTANRQQTLQEAGRMIDLAGAAPTPAAALELLQRAGALAPEAKGLAFAKAEALVALGRVDEAIALYSLAIKKDDDSRAVFALAQIKLNKDKPDEARTTLRDFIAKHEKGIATRKAIRMLEAL